MTFTIPPHELEVRASRASGPGGQHVNKTATRVEALWNVKSSSALSDEQRARLLTRLSHRLDSRGILRVVAQDERSQLRNREAAIERMHRLVRAALVVPKKRKPTRPTKAAKERRLESKKRRGRIKRERRHVGDD